MSTYKLLQNSDYKENSLLISHHRMYFYKTTSEKSGHTRKYIQFTVDFIYNLADTVRSLACLGTLRKASWVKLSHEAGRQDIKNVQKFISNTGKNVKYKILFI